MSALRSARPARVSNWTAALAVLLTAAVASVVTGCQGPDPSLARAFHSLVAEGVGGVVDLADLPSRPWTRYALIPGNASPDVIREATGLDETFGYPMGHDSALLLVLTADGELVAWADVNQDGPSQIRLGGLGTSLFVAGTHTAARFEVIETGELTVGGGSIYELAVADASP